MLLAQQISKFNHLPWVQPHILTTEIGISVFLDTTFRDACATSWRALLRCLEQAHVLGNLPELQLYELVLRRHVFENLPQFWTAKKFTTILFVSNSLPATRLQAGFKKKKKPLF